MRSSPGSERGHRGAGVNPDDVAAWATENYSELRRRRDRNAGLDEQTPRDLFAGRRRT